MADLAKTPDYIEESEHLTNLAKILVATAHYLEDHPVSYPLAQKAYAKIHKGLVKGMEELDEAFGSLELELDFEAPSHEYPADFSI